MSKSVFDTIVPALHSQGFMTRVIPASDEVPADQLLVVLDEEAEPASWRVEMVFLPELTEPYILQFFALLPIEVKEATLPNLARFILALNANLPLTGFELDEGSGWIYYRHLMPCPDNRALDVELTVDTMWLIHYVIDSFAPLLQDVVEGHKTLAQGLEALQESVAELRDQD